MKRFLIISLLLIAALPFPTSLAEDCIFEYMENELLEMYATESEYWTAVEIQSILDDMKTNGYMPTDALVYELTNQDSNNVDLDGSVHKFDALRFIAESDLGSMIHWTAMEKSRWQAIATEFGALDEIAVLTPTAGEISEDDARSNAMQGILDRFSISASDLSQYSTGANYGYASDGSKVWTLGFENSETQATFVVEVYADGTIGYIDHRETKRDTLEAYVEDLYAEKGSFREWSVADKAWFSAVLPSLITEAEAKDEHVPYDLPVIADYAFMTPDTSVLSQSEAEEIAYKEVSALNALPADWENDFDINMSLFERDGHKTWRVVYWVNVFDSAYGYGYIVEVDAETSEILLNTVRTKDISVYDMF